MRKQDLKTGVRYAHRHKRYGPLNLVVVLNTSLWRSRRPGNAERTLFHRDPLATRPASGSTFQGGIVGYPAMFVLTATGDEELPEVPLEQFEAATTMRLGDACDTRLGLVDTRNILGEFGPVKAEKDEQAAAHRREEDRRHREHTERREAARAAAADLDRTFGVGEVRVDENRHAGTCHVVLTTEQARTILTRTE